MNKSSSHFALFAPVDIVPSLSDIVKSKAKLSEVMDHFKRTLLCKIHGNGFPIKTVFIRYLSLPPKRVFDVLGAFIIALKIVMRIRRNTEKYTLCHGHTIYPDGLAAILVGKFYNISTVLTVHGSDVHSIRVNSFEFRVSRYAMNNANVIVSVSQSLKRQIIEKFDISKSKVMVINNGVSSTFSQVDKDYKIRNQYKIPNNAPVFIFIGNFVPIKDPALLINAFSRVSKHIPNAHLIMVGEGYLRNDIQKIGQNSDYHNKIHFTGSISHHNLASYLLESNILCISSKNEGWPTIIFEAFSCGVPIVATSVGGIAEAIPDDSYGLLVPYGDPGIFSRAMIQAIGMKWDKKKLIDYAKNNSWDQMAEQYFQCYKKS